MNEVYDIINNKKDKKKSFAITFDDGFENNISIAAPVLINLQIPFTIYITTSFVDKNAMSWIDKIDYAINETKKKQINIPELNKNFQIKNKNLKINFLNKIRKFLKENNQIDPYEFSSNFCKNLKITKFPKKYNL